MQKRYRSARRVQHNIKCLKRHLAPLDHPVGTRTSARVPCPADRCHPLLLLTLPEFVSGSGRKSTIQTLGEVTNLQKDIRHSSSARQPTQDALNDGTIRTRIKFDHKGLRQENVGFKKCFGSE